MVQSLGWEDPLEDKWEMATHSSILAWRIPWTEEPGKLQSVGSQSQTQLEQFTIQVFMCITVFPPPPNSYDEALVPST